MPTVRITTAVAVAQAVPTVRITTADPDVQEAHVPGSVKIHVLRSAQMSAKVKQEYLVAPVHLLAANHAHMLATILVRKIAKVLVVKYVIPQQLSIHPVVVLLQVV